MPKGFSNLHPNVGSNSTRMDELIDILTFPKDKWLTVRFLDTDILPVRQHWLTILTPKEKKEINIPKFCLAFDPEKEEVLTDVSCPYCEVTNGKASMFYLANVIVRDLQDDEPRKKPEPTDYEQKTGFKEITSKTWTPVRVVRLPSSLAQKIKELSELNKVKTKDGKRKNYDVSHIDFGIDVQIKFRPAASGTDKYTASAGDRTPLGDDEKEFLIWDLAPELLKDCGLQTEAEARADIKRMTILSDEDDKPPAVRTASRSHKLDLDEEDEDDVPVAKPAKRKAAVVDDEEDEDDVPVAKPAKRKAAVVDDEEDDFLDEAPTKKPAKRKAAVVDDDDDFLDEAPVTKPTKRKAAAVVDDDDDFLDEAPVAKPAKRKAAVVDDDDEEDEDEPVVTKPRKAKKSPF